MRRSFDFVEIEGHKSKRRVVASRRRVLRVGVVLITGKLGGAERVTLTLASEVVKRWPAEDHQVVLLKEGYEDVWSEQLGSRHFRGSRCAIRRWVDTVLCIVRSDLVFATHSKLGIGLCIVWSVFRLRRRKILVIRESTRIFVRLEGWRRRMRVWLYRMFLHNADLVIAQSNEMATELHSTVGTGRLRIKVMENPVDLELLQYKSQLAPDICLQAPYVVAAGSFIDEKGFDLLLHAFSQIDPSCRLVLLGDGPLKNDLVRLAKALGLENRIVFPGRVDNPYVVFRNAILGVVSSRIEGFPNTLLEMMALCPRVVSTRCADGVAELSGVYTCETRDSIVLADAIQEALEGDNRAAEMRISLVSRTAAAYVDRVCHCIGTARCE